MNQQRKSHLVFINKRDAWIYNPLQGHVMCSPPNSRIITCLTLGESA